MQILSIDQIKTYFVDVVLIGDSIEARKNCVHTTDCVHRIGSCDFFYVRQLDEQHCHALERLCDAKEKS